MPSKFQIILRKGKAQSIMRGFQQMADRGNLSQEDLDAIYSQEPQFKRFIDQLPEEETNGED